MWLDYRPNRTSESALDLVLKNEGPTTATQVKVRMDPPIPRIVNGTHRQFTDLAGFSDGFSALPPGREMRWILGTGREIFAQEGDQSHRITVSYHGPDGPVDPTEYTLDLRESKHTSIYTPATMKQLVEAIKAQTKAIGGLKEGQ